MAEVRIEAGGKFDVASSRELAQHTDTITSRFDEFIRDWNRGIKPMRFAVQGTLGALASGTTLDIGSPRAGFVWSVRRVTFTCDQAVSVNLYRGTDDTTNFARLIVQLTPPVMQVFSSDSLILQADETIVFEGGGTTAPGTTWINGEAIEVPAEMIGKLIS